MAIENLQKSEGITSHKSGLLNSHVSVRRPAGLPCSACYLHRHFKNQTGRSLVAMTTGSIPDPRTEIWQAVP